MVSGFLIPGGRLQVPEHITNNMLCNPALYPQWPHTEDGQPQCNAMVCLEYGKDNYWTGKKMVDYTIMVEIPIFCVAFLGTSHLQYTSRL